MIIKKFKKGYLKLTILIFISVLTGLHMLIYPLTVNNWVIRCVGLLFVVESISYAIELVKKHIENKPNK